jgi:hypothetical protein
VDQPENKGEDSEKEMIHLSVEVALLMALDLLRMNLRGKTLPEATTHQTHPACRLQVRVVLEVGKQGKSVTSLGT